MGRVYLCCLSLALVYNGCQGKKDNRIFIVEDQILYEITYFKGTTNLKTKHELNSDSVKHGESKEFFAHGGLRSLAYFKNGKLEGEKLTFYPNINVKYFDLLEEDTVVIEHPAFKSYELYGSNEELRFRLIYNKNGKVVDAEGSLFPLVRVNQTRLKVGEKLHGQFYLVDPPDTEISVFASLYTKENILVEDTLEINEEYGAAFFNMVFNDKGDYKLKVVGMIKDLDTNNIMQDTLQYDIKVEGDLDLI